MERAGRMSKVELKLCPFCGSSNTTLDYYEISCPQELGTIVICKDCGASSTRWSWNTRPIEDALNARIAELEEAQRWIPIASGRLPEKFQECIVLDKNKRVHNWIHDDALLPLFAEYTHWMPLPVPPEVQK